MTRKRSVHSNRCAVGITVIAQDSSVLGVFCDSVVFVQPYVPLVLDERARNGSVHSIPRIGEQTTARGC